MTYAITYSTRTGNTKLLAENIKNTIKKDSLVYYGPLADEALKADYIFVGFWTDMGKCDKDTFSFLAKLQNKKIFLFGTAGFGESQEYFAKIIERTKEAISSTNEIVDSFMCQGKMPMAVKDKYLKLKNSNTKIPNIDMLINNFDKALSHPDANDLALLKLKLKEI